MTTLPQTTPVRVPRALPTTQLAMPGPMMLGAGGPGAGPVAGALTANDIWRVIRANIWLILLTLIVAGATGYAVNMWLAAKHSRYTSTGLVRVQVESDKPSVDGRNASPNPAELEIEQNTQANQFTHEGLIASLLETSDPVRQTEWFKQFKTVRNGQEVVDAEAAKTDLLEHLSVSPVTSSRLLRVQMSWSVPKDCKTIVEEIVNLHIKRQKELVSIRQVDMSGSLEQLKLNYDSQIRDMNARMLRIATELGQQGVGTGNGGNSKEFELTSLISEQLRALAIVGAAAAKQATFEKQMETNSAPELEDALQHSGIYAEYRRAVDELQIGLSEVTQSQGPLNPRVQSLKRRLDAMQQKLEDTENDIRSRTAELIRANLANDRNAAESALKRINVRVSEIRSEIADMATKRNEYDRLAREVQVLRSSLDHVKDEQDKVGYLLGQGKWSPIEWATLPDLPDHPTFPRQSVTLAIALAIGMALSVGIAFLRELTDTSVRSPRDIARVGHLQLLGMIPHESDDPQSAGARLPLAIFEAPHSIVAEQFRQVRTRLQHTASLDTTRSILVTSCGPEDGKTVVSCNLASGLALNGRRILLVDANFRRPDLHNIFNTPNEVGFGDVLNNLDVFEEAVVETEVPNLSVLSAGQRPSNPTELLESQLLIDFIERALEEYDHVIFDSGPMLMVSDTIALAPRVDGVITVVRARGNSRGMLGRMRDELRRLKAEHLGVVLNAVRVQGGGYYGPMIKNYYAYQNG